MTTVHHLKTWPQFFEQSRAGVKPFEVRKNDRPFKVGDIIVLDPQFCLPGYVVLGLK